MSNNRSINEFDPLSSVTDLEGAVLWSDSIF